MYYNQIIGGSDLNNIAIDLGKGDFSTFADSQTYAVDKLNEITQSLVSEGVLNAGQLCRVTYSNGTVTVAPGVVVMQSGAKHRFTSNTSVANVTPPCYVYVTEDATHNTTLCVKDTIDATYYVQLAYIDANGNVSQLASLCQSKVMPLSDATPATYTIPVGTTTYQVNSSNFVGIYVVRERGGGSYMKNPGNLKFGTECIIDCATVSATDYYYHKVTYSPVNKTLTFKHSRDGLSWSDKNDYELQVTLF